jgi:hypothetical protein
MNPEATMNIDFGDVQPRIKQSYLPFAVLFLNNPQQLEKFIAEVKKRDDEVLETRSHSVEGYIVDTYISLMYEPVITAKKIADKLKEDKMEDVTASTIGRITKTMGFDSKPVSYDGKTYRNVTIDGKSLKQLIRQYIPKIEQPVKLNRVSRDSNIVDNTR